MALPFRGDANLSMPGYMNAGEPITHRLSFHQPGSLGIRDHMNQAYRPNQHMMTTFSGSQEAMTSGYSRANMLPPPVAQPFATASQYQQWPSTSVGMTHNSYHPSTSVGMTHNSYSMPITTTGPAMTEMSPMNLMASVAWQTSNFQEQHQLTSQTMFGVGPDPTSALWPFSEQRL